MSKRDQFDSADRSLALECDCVGKCSILNVNYDRWDENPATWTWDFYTNSGYDLSWRHRLRIIWNLLRGKEHYFHGTVHTTEDMRRLRAFLDQTLRPKQKPIQLPLPPGQTLVCDFIKGEMRVDGVKTQ